MKKITQVDIDKLTYEDFERVFISFLISLTFDAHRKGLLNDILEKEGMKKK